MQKDFDKWNNIKKKIETKSIARTIYFYEREVWWCSLGLNVGVESDGKSNNFERPALIIKKFNSDMLWVVPLTSKEKTGEHYHKVMHEGGVSWVCLSQVRSISTKRLLRKIGMVDTADFVEIIYKVVSYIKIGPRITARSSEAEATNASSIDSRTKTVNNDTR